MKMLEFIVGSVMVALIIVTLVRHCTTAEADDVIRCTNGTEVIFIQTPGMCPPGYYPT
jgi:hypothetical protein